MRLIDELKRRNVFRVGAAYVLLGWIIVQVTDTVSPALNLPDWTLSFVTWIGIVGFPIALFFAWAYELTPDGIKREVDVDSAESITAATGRKLDIALIGLLVVTIGMIAWDTFSRTQDEETPVSDTPSDTVDDDASPSPADSIAVLPLTNMSAVTENAFFAGGVHEEILTNLSRIEGLRVISRTTALRYMNSDLSLRDVGRELGVRYIVEGSVRRIQNHVRITVQLIDAVNDSHLWANNYDRELVDVFATQSEVAREITNSLHLQIRPDTVGALDDMPTLSVKAYDLYLKAKSIDRSEMQTEATLRRQRELLEVAVEEDPSFVEAWGYLNEVLDEMARTIIQNDWFGDTEVERDTEFADVRSAAQRALDKAVTLDPDNIETLLAQASDFVTEQEDADFRTSRKKYIDQALELEPDNAFARYVLAWWYRIEGNMRLATPTFLEALELDPFHARIVAGSLFHFRLTGDQEMTDRLFERLAQIAPETGEDDSLAEVPALGRLDKLMTQFVATADESIVEAYETEFARSIGSFGHPVEETLSRARMMEFKHDVEGMANLSVGAPPETGVWDHVWGYILVNDLVLAAQRLAGRSDEAKATARRLVDLRRKYGQLSNLGAVAQIDRFTLAAHIELGNDDRLREIREWLLHEDGTLVDDYQVLSYVALSHLDLDRGVEFLLAQKAQHPSWYGTDMIAAFHIWARHIIVHPDMQRFYVDEGKWIDHLAAGVPEYAQYRQ